MSILSRFCPGDACGLLIANVLVQVTAVILAAWLLAWLGSRWNAAWRHSVYLAALVCVLASPMFSWLMQASGITLVALQSSAPTASAALPAHMPAAEPAEVFHLPEFRSVETPAVAAQPSVKTEIVEQGFLAEGPSSPRLYDVFRTLGGGALAIWTLGVVWLLARWGHGLHLIATLRRTTRPLNAEPFAKLLDQVRRVLGTDRLPPMATAAGVDRPIMIGLIRPLVILPENMLWRLHGPELADVLVHECAHAVCRHQVVGLLQRLAATLFWPHPLVHLLNRELAQAREEVCDNYVLRRGDAPRYARTLLELSQLLADVSPKTTALGLFHCRWRLEDRVAALLDRRRNVMIRVNRWTAGALTALFLSLALPIAGTRAVEAEPAADNAADVKTTETTIEKTIRKTIEKATTGEAAAAPAKKDTSPSASFAISSAEVGRRAVNKLVKDLPEKADLSTPESALAAFYQNLARKDIQAAFELSWVKIDADLAKTIEEALKNDPNAPKDFAQQCLDAEIVEVLTYNDDLAAVILKRNGDSDKVPYSTILLGKIDGVWKSFGFIFFPGDSGDSPSPSVQAAEESFENRKDDLWRQFLELRNDIQNGRTPTIGSMIRKKGGDTVPPFLSAAEREEIERTQRETWQISMTLDMPKLEPQAVQFAILDKDPIPALVAQVDRMRARHREQLKKATNEARRKQLSAIQMAVAWDFGFKEVDGHNLGLLTGRSGASNTCSITSSNRPDGKKWVVTKTVYVKGKPICWCIPVETKTGERVDVTLDESNTLDLRSVYIYDNAVREHLK